MLKDKNEIYQILIFVFEHPCAVLSRPVTAMCVAKRPFWGANGTFRTPVREIAPANLNRAAPLPGALVEIQPNKRVFREI